MRDYFFNQGRRDDATWIVKNWSEPFDADQNGMWISQTTGRIKQAEVVVVLLGQTAFRCPGVLKEVAIAQMLGKKIYQIVPHGAGSPNVIPNAGRVLRWEWDNIKRAIASSPARWNTAQQIRV